MKITKKLTIILIVLAIILLSCISFIGIYKLDLNRMVNIMPEYILGMDLTGSRVINLSPSVQNEQIVKDAEGNIIEDATEEEILENGYQIEELPYNSEDVLTKQNYDRTKSIIEKRMKSLNVSSYHIRENKENGNIVVEIEENYDTDDVIAYLYTMGKFEIRDNDTKELLMDSSDIKNARVMYGNASSGTSVYLEINFNKEGAEKLRQISNTYVASTDEEGNDTTKKIELVLDEQTITTTYFGQEMATGVLQLTVGNAVTDQELFNQYVLQASRMATLLNNGEIPIVYEIESNLYIKSAIENTTLNLWVCIFILIILIIAICFIIKYKIKGLFCAISNIGFLATVLLILRFTNVVLTIEGLVGIVLITALNYIVLFMLLSKLSKEAQKAKQEEKNIIKQTIIKYCFIIIPIYLLSIVFLFISHLNVQSFGMCMFWGITISILFNIFVTRLLLLSANKK